MPAAVLPKATAAAPFAFADLMVLSPSAALSTLKAALDAGIRGERNPTTVAQTAIDFFLAQKPEQASKLLNKEIAARLKMATTDYGGRDRFASSVEKTTFMWVLLEGAGQLDAKLRAKVAKLARLSGQETAFPDIFRRQPTPLWPAACALLQEAQIPATSIAGAMWNATFPRRDTPADPQATRLLFDFMATHQALPAIAQTIGRDMRWAPQLCQEVEDALHAQLRLATRKPLAPATKALMERTLSEVAAIKTLQGDSANQPCSDADLTRSLALLATARRSSLLFAPLLAFDCIMIAHEGPLAHLPAVAPHLAWARQCANANSLWTPQLASLVEDRVRHRQRDMTAPVIDYADFGQRLSALVAAGYTDDGPYRGIYQTAYRYDPPLSEPNSKQRVNVELLATFLAAGLRPDAQTQALLDPAAPHQELVKDVVIDSADLQRLRALAKGMQAATMVANAGNDSAGPGRAHDTVSAAQCTPVADAMADLDAPKARRARIS